MRFISRDSYSGKIQDPLSLNIYTYCHNNHIFYNDSTGHIAVVDDILFWGTMLLLFGGAASATYTLTTPYGQQAINDMETAIDEAGQEIYDTTTSIIQKIKTKSKTADNSKSTTISVPKEKKENEPIIYLATRNFSSKGYSINLVKQITEEEALQVICSNSPEGIYTQRKGYAKRLAQKASIISGGGGKVIYHTRPEQIKNNIQVTHIHTVLSSGREGNTHIWYGTIIDKSNKNSKGKR